VGEANSIVVIASEAKQSIFPRKGKMDCFVASAQNCFAILSRAPLRKRFAFVAGNDGGGMAYATIST
jgi:hypothetical protein